MSIGICNLAGGGADVSPVTVTLPSQVAKDKVIVGADGLPITGTYNMDNLIESNVKSGVAFGAGKTGTFSNGVTATDADVLTGKTYARNGVIGTGNIPNHVQYDNVPPAEVWTFNDLLYYIPPNGHYFNGGGLYKPVSDVLNTIGAKRYASGSYSPASWESDGSYYKTLAPFSGLGFVPKAVSAFIDYTGNDSYPWRNACTDSILVHYRTDNTQLSLFSGTMDNFYFRWVLNYTSNATITWKAWE